MGPYLMCLITSIYEKGNNEDMCCCDLKLGRKMQICLSIEMLLPTLLTFMSKMHPLN